MTASEARKVTGSRLTHSLLPSTSAPFHVTPFQSGQPTRLLLRRCLLETVPILWREDIPATILCTTMAGLWGLIIQLVAIVVREFLTCLDILDRYNPDDTPELFGLAVWVTRMI